MSVFERPVSIILLFNESFYLFPSFAVSLFLFAFFSSIQLHFECAYDFCSLSKRELKFMWKSKVLHSQICARKWSNWFNSNKIACVIVISCRQFGSHPNRWNFKITYPKQKERRTTDGRTHCYNQSQHVFTIYLYVIGRFGTYILPITNYINNITK